MTLQQHRTVILLAVLAIFAGGNTMADPSPSASGLARATVGGGCFWCIEAVFDEVAGVTAAESGYAGGDTPDPDYRSVCSGETGHAEVVQVTFDPAVISFEEILVIFFGVHDPTTLNRQGADVGTQYRSIILAHDEQQRKAAEALIGRLEADEVYGKPIVTEVTMLGDYYRAEDHHQDYFRKNPAQGYCQAVIAPKLAKFRKEFADQLQR